jgi:tryptophan 2,3-dioxygenase
MLFIIIHQTYELWFKQILHEFAEAARTLESGNSHYALALLGRIRTIMKVCVTQIDILETMTPLQFNAFRGFLSSSSGFQSAQFRKESRGLHFNTDFPEQASMAQNIVL